MKSKLTVLSILCISLLLLSCGGGKKVQVAKTPGVQFTKSKTLSALLDKAELENKLVFVDFYTTWCLPCRLMDEEVFPNERVGDFMNDNFINYKVDAEKDNGVNLAFVYEVSAYPTLLFLDSKGRVIEKKIGAVFHDELLTMAERALTGVQ